MGQPGHRRMRRASILKFWMKCLGFELLSDIERHAWPLKLRPSLRELQAAGRAGKTLARTTPRRWPPFAIGRSSGNISIIRSVSKISSEIRYDADKNFPACDDCFQTKSNITLAAGLPWRNERRVLVRNCSWPAGLRANELRSLRIQHIDAVANGLRLEVPSILPLDKGPQGNFSATASVLGR